MPACAASAGSSACRPCRSCCDWSATGRSLPVTPAERLVRRCQFPAAGVAAVSGGADSTALLVLAVEAGCDVTAVHVDHGLRPDSAADADHVAALAAHLGVPFRAERVEVAPGANLDARARDPRRAVLPRDAMTGHPAD